MDTLVALKIIKCTDLRASNMNVWTTMVIKKSGAVWALSAVIMSFVFPNAPSYVQTHFVFYSESNLIWSCSLFHIPVLMKKTRQFFFFKKLYTRDPNKILLLEIINHWFPSLQIIKLIIIIIIITNKKLTNSNTAVRPAGTMHSRSNIHQSSSA